MQAMLPPSLLHSPFAGAHECFAKQQRGACWSLHLPYEVGPGRQARDRLDPCAHLKRGQHGPPTSTLLQVHSLSHDHSHQDGTEIVLQGLIAEQLSLARATNLSRPPTLWAGSSSALIQAHKWF